MRMSYSGAALSFVLHGSYGMAIWFAEVAGFTSLRDIQLIVVIVAHHKSLRCRFPGKPSRIPLENDFFLSASIVCSAPKQV